jgi:uncharacterized membrane protein YdjX (TVP38/TMEM64 family)
MYVYVVVGIHGGSFCSSVVFRGYANDDADFSEVHDVPILGS